MKRFLFCCLMLLYAAGSAAQADYTPEDTVLFNRYAEQFREERKLPFNELVTRTALFFSGTPYVAATLEKEPEQLVINLREMDCTTFVETVLALARTVRGDTLSFDAFTRELQNIRYYNSLIDGYASRKHYFTDWIQANEQQGIVADRTREAGGVPWHVQVSFMSEHPDKYKQLAADPVQVKLIRARETEINARPYTYIPKEKIAEAAAHIRNGDILSFTTTIAGLDVSHTGYAYWKDGTLTFIHASSTGRRVIVNPRPLIDYTAGIRSNSGIRIARPL
ncbi:MAG: DUF1460 domain-containing protein [Parabacteroides sp.]|nr:DUF1460 domain-containing protein [Parabacteroides sp.]